MTTTKWVDSVTENQRVHLDAKLQFAYPLKIVCNFLLKECGLMAYKINDGQRKTVFEINLITLKEEIYQVVDVKEEIDSWSLVSLSSAPEKPTMDPRTLIRTCSLPLSYKTLVFSNNTKY